MANFPPLKNYILFCIDKLIERYDISYPFLDVGCGIADISQFAASKGWYGKAIDISGAAIEVAKKNLARFPGVEVSKQSLFQETGSFKTIFFIDALEHITDDIAALEKVNSLLFTNGYLILSVPSNPCEWRCDDDFYGHCRRYDFQEIETKLIVSGLTPLEFWDCTYPVFWAMRRIYTRFKPLLAHKKQDRFSRTLESSLVNAWDVPGLSDLLSKKSIFWDTVYKIQFKYFKDRLHNGHEIIILARKQDKTQQNEKIPRS
jgi:SAM-dependent methyltransferase